MKTPERPPDFSDDEYAELCELAKAGVGIPNPDYVRAALKTETFFFYNKAAFETKYLPHPALVDTMKKLFPEEFE